MKMVLMMVVWLMISGVVVFADTISTTIGNTTYFSGDNQGTATKVGSTIYYNVNGERGTEVRVGKTTYFNGELFEKGKE